MARCQGAQIEDPKWDDDRHSDNKQEKRATPDEEYEKMKLLHKRMKDSGELDIKNRLVAMGNKIIPK